MAPEVEASKPVSNQGAADGTAELGKFYLQLLEKRIADLEETIKKLNEKKDEVKVEKKQEAGEGKKAEVDGKKKLRFRSVIMKWDDTEVEDPNPNTSTNENSGDISFTFRKIMPSQTNTKDNYCEVDIQSKALRDLLAEVVGRDYPGQSWDGDIVNISAPFMPLVHFWGELQKAMVDHPNDNEEKKQARSDLKDLLDKVSSSPDLESYFKIRESHLSAKITTYDTVWSIFVPGQKVYASPFMNIPQLLTVQHAPYWDRFQPVPPATVGVDCWCYDWNGKEMVKVFYEIAIEQFRGSKPINELAVYPLQYYDDPKGTYKNKEELCAMLLKRGCKYNSIVRGPKGASQMYQYNGEALADRRGAIQQNEGSQDQSSGIDTTLLLQRFFGLRPSRQKFQPKRKLTVVKSRFIVDAECFLGFGPGAFSLGEIDPDSVEQKNDPDIQSWSKSAEEKTNDFSDAERAFLLLLPPRLLGYSTQEKFWGQFKVDATHKVSAANTDLFDKELQLDDHYKKMIRALVLSHTSKNDSENGRVQVRDVVDNKGKGLVILLHGPPGVGKTLTAETIAEASGKPLFIVSVAEIGLDASNAEKNLEKLFVLAGTWDAVLLIDEADVFLESRTPDGDLHRNSLVSVLLRVLEYYQGIMILTTNRITSLDIAVQSRIHLAIRYEDLTKKFKQEIFKMFLDQLEPDSIKDHAGILDWIADSGREQKLNGREIRNIVTSALALARSEARENGGDGRLTKSHLKTVMGITNDFKEQLDSVTKIWRNANEVGRASK